MVFTAPTWDLQTILGEFRSITGLPDVSMYTDQQCSNLINYFYQYVLPKELKISWGYTFYQFFTQPNVDQYLAPSTFQTFNPSVWADGWPLVWYTDPDTFYQDYPQQVNKVTVGTATGLNAFSFNFTYFPVLPRSMYVTDGTQIAQDNGIGGFVNPLNANAPLLGTIDYATGTVDSLEFPAIPDVGLTITATAQTYVPSRPRGILFFPQTPLPNATPASLAAVEMFVIRPVPGEVHLIKMQGISLPQPLLNYTDVPFRPDLGPLIALGAALHRFKLFNQMDQYNQYVPEYTRFKDVCMQDTYEEMLYNRSISKF